MKRIAAIAWSLLGCGTRVPPAAPSPPPFGGFASQAQREAACLDLRDHATDLYADQYVAAQGNTMPPEARVVFRELWGERLAKSGAYERFEEACFAGLTVARWGCGMAASTPDAIQPCMRLVR